MNGQILTPQQEKIEALHKLFPEAFSEGKIDWEKLKATLGENINFANERYVLNWAGKSDAFRVMQQPSTRTLVPMREDSVNFDDTQNIFIEGENLEVLKVLQKSYFGKVKMIYIDPPYNTGNDSFIYPDKFSETKEEYQKRVGDLVKTNHSELTTNHSKPTTNHYYIINDGELVLLLESVTQEIIDDVLAKQPKKVIALDGIFKGNDQLKTNTALQMKDAGVEFKTI